MNQINCGMGLFINGEVYIVQEFHHVKPGKGAAFMRTKLRSLKTNSVIEKTFKPSDKLENVFLEEKTLQYLYRSGDSFNFMDQSTYEEVTISAEQLDDMVKYIQDNLEVKGIFYNKQLQKVILPNFIITSIIEAEPGFKGDSAKSVTKPAQIDTGAGVQVPLFVNKGDWIKIDTRTGQYIERVKR